MYQMFINILLKSSANNTMKYKTLVLYCCNNRKWKMQNENEAKPAEKKRSKMNEKSIINQQ